MLRRRAKREASVFGSLILSFVCKNTGTDILLIFVFVIEARGAGSKIRRPGAGAAKRGAHGHRVKIFLMRYQCFA